jgi:hypothetical protein
VVDPNSVSSPASSGSSLSKSAFNDNSSSSNELIFGVSVTGVTGGDAGGESGREAFAVINVCSLEPLVEPALDISGYVIRRSELTGNMSMVPMGPYAHNDVGICRKTQPLHA